MPGTFKFTWAHPAEEVYVTGTFDDWTKSEKLEKVGDKFEKTVTLADASKKIYYKFVVDNNWITDHTAPSEPDHEGNVNNFLTPEQIVKEEPTAAAAVMNTVTPDATTAALAKDVPVEKKAEDSATPLGGPGGFPTTPADELDNKTVSVNPLPATDVTEPSLNLAPGEPIPASAKAGDINAAVTLDKESYEKSDRLPGLTDENSKLPEASATTIPESGLPMPAAAIAAATIDTVTPASTTAALAAEVPKEPKTAEVPEVVKESQEKVDASPEASAQPVEVAEKAAVEDELKEKVPEAPSTAEGTAGFGTEKSEKAGIAATAVTAGGIALAAATAATNALFSKAEPAATEASEATSDAAKKASVAATTAANDLPEGVKEQLPESAQEAIKTQAQENVRHEVAPNVPEEVKESLTEAGKGPEAAANPAAVEDKKEVESELLKEVKAVPAVGESKATTSETTAIKPLETAVKPIEGETKPTEELATLRDNTAEVPKETKAEETKTAETKTEAPKTETTKETNGTTATDSKAAAPATPAKAESSSKPASTTPSTGAATSEKKKKNRLSAFIGKIKSKVSHKD